VELEDRDRGSGPEPLPVGTEGLDDVLAAVVVALGLEDMLGIAVIGDEGVRDVRTADR
jgi:hypothetical protein